MKCTQRECESNESIIEDYKKRGSDHMMWKDMR